MKIREITDQDFPEIFRWFSKRKWPLPPIEGAAPRWGMIAESEYGALLACVYCYTTKSSIAFVDWTGTNPDLPDLQTHSALAAIIKSLQKACASVEPKIRALCLYTQNKSLANKLSDLGFSTDEGYTRCLWSLRDTKNQDT